MKAKASEFDRLIGHLEKDILDRNLDRVKTLVDTYRSFRRLRLPLKGRSDAADILRAATVMLHATLEELLRGLAIARISFADASTLRHIPLLGVSEAGRPEKFDLGKLAAFRGKKVDEVIWNSVEAYYTTSASFNNTTDISVVLRHCRIDPATLSVFFPMIDAMIKRRHRIVHRADRKEGGRYAHGRFEASLSASVVSSWLSTVRRFGDALLAISAGSKVKGMKTPPNKRSNRTVVPRGRGPTSG